MPTRIDLKTKCARSINLLIQNCCDPVIQEIISFDTPGLPPIGAFSDSEGNCWSLIGTTTNPINSIRIVDNLYGSCETCIIDNPCPDNLIVNSCCGNFETIFSSALPGVGVGDTFVDTFGFCWNILNTTSAPINGVVNVDTVYLAEDCTTCLYDNTCPEVYNITSCCKSTCDGLYINLYTTLELLGGGSPGETFIDQFGFCWTIGSPEEGFTLLTGSFIQYVELTEPCAIGDPCSDKCADNVFYTIQNCLTLQVEVIEYTFGLHINATILISFTTVINPRCYKIISWDNTSLPTKIVDRIEDCFRSCQECLIN